MARPLDGAHGSGAGEGSVRIGACAAATAVWGCALAGTQVVGRAAAVSCANRFGAAHALGCTAVALGAIGSAQAARLTHRWHHRNVPPWTRPLEGLAAEHVARQVALGGALFKAVGGSFSRLLPSRLDRPGACRTASLPATAYYASPAQRARLLSIFRRNGCHSCGSRAGAALGAFVADHQPPNKIVAQVRELPRLRRWLAHLMNPELRQQRFFPQCRSCSALQASAMRGTVRSVLVTHRRLLQRPQLLLVGALLGALVDM